MVKASLKVPVLLVIFLIVPVLVVAETQINRVKGVSAADIGINSASVTWNKSNQAKYYQLRLQKSNGENIKTWKSLSGNSKSISSSSGLLKQNKQYLVKIRACIKNNCSKWSAVKSFNTLIDSDGDEVDSTLDCNDADSTVDEYVTYYLDSDGDGLGDSHNSTTVCSASAPIGYVMNVSDANDDDYDNDGYITSGDCNDTDASIYTTYFADVDQDGYGNPNSTTCAGSSIPSGYVSNSTDADDNDYFNGNYPVCSSDTYNCSDFTTQFRAQKFYDYCVGQGAGDIHNLDGDADGEACESLN